MMQFDVNTGEVVEHPFSPGKPVFYKAPHQYDYAVESEACGERNDEPSLTVQSHSDDADINMIVKRMASTGMPPRDVRPVVYDDFSGVTDYRSALEAVMRADDAFNSLSGEVRYRFQNSPQRFLQFCDDPANLDEMVKMGLAVKRVGVSDGGVIVGGSASSGNSATVGAAAHGSPGNGGSVAGGGSPIGAGAPGGGA